ncbi:oxidoreductase [Agrocybe pediades]|nr:oxidoreductase [Agrocybe pediades]
MSQASPVVFITGCSNGGIGSALAVEFAQRGCLVYASARSVTAMSDLPESIRKLQLDVTNDTACEKAVQTIIEEAGHIDIFISNAGVANVGPLLDITVETAQKVMDTNLFGTVRLVRLIGPHMVKRKKGLIIPVGSTAGELSIPFMGYYNPSKAALHAYTETLALELKPFGVHVMLCSPGSVKSNIADVSVSNLPEGSFYSANEDKMTRVLFYGQNRSPMPTNKFAKVVVDKALTSSPPTYMTAGGTTTLWSFLKWLPRPFALKMIWNATVGELKV